jgi:MFS family permease
MVAEAISAPLYAPLADRIGRRPIIIFLLFLWGFFAVGFGLVQNVWSAVLVRGACTYWSCCRREKF